MQRLFLALNLAQILHNRSTEQKYCSTNFMGVGRGEAYLLRKCAEQFLMHFHITHFYCILITCAYEALRSRLAGVSNVLIVNIIKLIQLTFSAHNFM